MSEDRVSLIVEITPRFSVELLISACKNIRGK